MEFTPPAASIVLSDALSALSAIAFIAAAAALIVSITEVPLPRAALLRHGSALLSGLLLGASQLHRIPPWALALSCLGFLMSVQAMAIEFGRIKPLRSYLSRRPAGEDPAWWAEFERSFWRHVSPGKRNDEPPAEPHDPSASERS
jgi:hypothetical protein